MNTYEGSEARSLRVAYCKTCNHGLSIHEIRGQEVCYMLGLTQQMNIVSRTRTSYRVPSL
jgi:hypothetical protein